MLKRTATRAARKISAHIPGGMAFARRMHRKSITIVMYHGIVEKPLPVYNWCQLLCEEFDRQICYLSHEYQVLPLPELVERIQKGLPVDENALCVTFDDGFQSIRKLAFPAEVQGSSNGVPGHRTDWDYRDTLARATVLRALK